MSLIIGNLIALIGSILMVYSGILQEKKKILYVQTIQISLFVISDLILGGITGAIINAVSLIRNILCYKNKLDIKSKILITGANLILCILFNNLGLIGFLPLISTISYIWLMTIKDVKKFKLLIAFTMLLWLIYDISIRSYTKALFDFINLSANMISLMNINKK